MPELSSCQRLGETIEYSRKKIEDYFNAYELPCYISKYSCGITAGGNAISFYNRIYDGLIPNHAGKMFFGQYSYAPHDARIDAVFDYLYTAMDATPKSVKIDGYIKGVKSYVAGKGRTALFESAMNDTGNPDIARYKAALSSGRLLTVFATEYSLIDFSNFHQYNGYDTIIADPGGEPHIMTALGYRDILYYDSSDRCFREDNYLYVFTGFASPAFAMINISKHCDIYDCYIFEIC